MAFTDQKLAAALPFDARPIHGSTTADLDLRMIETKLLPLLQPPEVLAKNGCTLDQRLVALRFCGFDGTPTIAGMLVAGRDPTKWLPGAYVQFLRVDGEELTEPAKSENRIDGTLFEVLSGSNYVVLRSGGDREPRRPVRDSERRELWHRPDRLPEPDAG